MPFMVDSGIALKWMDSFGKRLVAAFALAMGGS